jgi:hypothetical protein
MWNRSSPASSQHPALEKRPDYDRDHTKARTASLAQRRADTRRTSGNASGNAGSRRTRGADNSYTPAGRGYGSAGGYSSAKAPLPARLLTALFKSPVTAIVALALVLILLLVLWALAANSCTKQTDEFIPASGAALTESEAIDPDTGLAIPDLSDDLLPDPRYGPFQLVVEPASETTPWTEITVDGENVFTGMLDVKMTWEVIDYCEVSTAQPGNLTVKRNDTAEEMDIDEDGIASIRLDVEERPANDRTTNAPAEGQQSSGTSDEG